MIAVNATFFDLVAIFGKVLNSSPTGGDICQIVDNPTTPKPIADFGTDPEPAIANATGPSAHE